MQRLILLRTSPKHLSGKLCLNEKFAADTSTFAAVAAINWNHLLQRLLLPFFDPGLIFETNRTRIFQC